MFLNKINFLIIISLFLYSCGYHLVGNNRELPGGYRRVSIPVFKNRTHETGIEVSFTNAMRQQFQTSQVAQVSTERESEVVVIGSIESLDYEPQGKKVSGDSAPYLPEGTVLASDYRVVIKIRVSLQRVSDKVTLWTGDFRGESSYTAPQVTVQSVNTVNPLYNLSARRSAIETLANDLMIQAHNQMTENF